MSSSPTIAFGGDYNPEQWPAEIWKEDVRLMRQAGVTVATVGVFSWAKLEPEPGRFEFAWLDRVLDLLHGAGVEVDLATATASPPAWLAHRHPEALPVNRNGTRLSFGSRQAYCPSSPVYRAAVERLVTALVERYAEHPGLKWWHVNNEYACHLAQCYCDVSAAAFREWLERRYGSIDELNRAWGTAFWSQSYAGFHEVEPPRAAPYTPNPTQRLDYDRFSSDELLDCLRVETGIIRPRSDRPVTTNFMGLFKPLDYWRWASEVDFISDDCYPDPADPSGPMSGAMAHDLSRSLGGGAPWVLMEQASSAVNWRDRNVPKRSGMNRAWSMQSLARGADGILYFQWRQSIAGSEKFHSAMLPHSGPDTRVFREVCALGAELAGLSRLTGSTVQAEVAIVLDWESWWAIEQDSLPLKTSYLDGIRDWYELTYRENITVDFAHPTSDLSRYRLVIVPRLFIIDEEVATNLAAYVRGGGRLLVTNRSGILDRDAHLQTHGYLGSLSRLLGVAIDEFWPLSADEQPSLTTGGRGDDLVAVEWAELLINLDAEVMWRHSSGPLLGTPAVTRRRYGAGAVWYCSVDLGSASRAKLLARIAEEAGVGGIHAPEGVEIVRRGERLFAINHTGSPADLTLDGKRAVLEPFEALIIEG